VRVEYSALFSGTVRQNAEDLGEREVLCFLIRCSDSECNRGSGKEWSTVLPSHVQCVRMERTRVRLELSAFVSATVRQNAEGLGESGVLCFHLRYREVECRGPGLE
jgi:hypothetical protein